MQIIICTKFLKYYEISNCFIFVIFACIIHNYWYNCMQCIPELVYLQYANVTPCVILYISLYSLVLKKPRYHISNLLLCLAWKSNFCFQLHPSQGRGLSVMVRLEMWVNSLALENLHINFEHPTVTGSIRKVCGGIVVDWWGGVIVRRSFRVLLRSS